MRIPKQNSKEYDNSKREFQQKYENSKTEFPKKYENSKTEFKGICEFQNRIQRNMRIPKQNSNKI